MTEFIRSIFYVIYRLFPRHGHAVVYGWPDGEDNSLALVNGLQKSHLNQIILLVSGDPASLPRHESARIRIVRKNSPSGVFWFLTARYVFFTHRCFVHRFPSDVVSVNVWHGMPIKKIGTMLPGSDVVHSSHLLATSPFWGEIMRKAMCPDARVLNIGLPRNDLFFTDSQQVRSRLNHTREHRLLVWLPTYRHSVRGATRQDGCKFGNIFEFPGIDPEQMNAFLKERNATIYIKPHPMAMSDQPAEWSNLIMIDDPWLSRNHLTLYALLAASDALISDVSSVVIDYLLLNRPIIHAFADVEDYRNSRGFSVEPIEDYFCGPVVSNQEQLIACLKRIINSEDPDSDKRLKMLNLSHSHCDNNSTSRLLAAIGIL